jgi:adenylylsulfate kinase
MTKLLIMGLPGSGKTTLAESLKGHLAAVHFNADLVRKHINKDVGFSLPDRIEQAARMGFLCDTVVAAGHYAIADFVCPTEETRRAFGPAFVIWVDRISKSAFADTNQLFEPPREFDVRLKEGDVTEWTQMVLRTLESLNETNATDSRS